MSSSTSRLHFEVTLLTHKNHSLIKKILYHLSDIDIATTAYSTDWIIINVQST